ncbi:glycosyltransferase family 9 protein [Leucobacter sp. CSA1]|uniref:Glycosyltransferase family 9 protein n=1 Tax=Leucobacter chromiisoli TaxID=2796471 RepID=A0A934QAV7_9MICO|nr:glycosyltransferase family 9 protein [Leucobacter chromiisoli]MBK0419722.1 glycosyltransferase family 9 protein [Leucobacter chromiisoli]
MSHRDPDAPRLLALRALKLGDLLVAVPAIRAIRRARPDHRLILAMPEWLRPIIDLIGGVDEHHAAPGLDEPLPIAPGRIDTAVNLHGNGPESRAVIDALEARAVVAHGDRVPWLDGILERRRWVRLVEAFGMPGDPDEVRIERPSVPPLVGGGAAVVHVGAFYGSRQWPAERFGVVAESLASEGRRVVFTGSGAERARALDVARLAGLPEDAVLAGRMSLGEFAAQIADAELVVSADTGAAHLASAYGTPSVVLFGPAPPEEWGPPPGPHIVLTDASQRRGETFSEEPDPALLAVTARDVLAAVRDLPRRRAPAIPQAIRRSTA